MKKRILRRGLLGRSSNGKITQNSKILPTDRCGKVKSRVFRQKNGNGRMKLQGTEKVTSKEEIRKITQKVWNLGQ